MISAHLNGQIFGNIGICPYCSKDEEGTQVFPDPQFQEKAIFSY